MFSVPTTDQRRGGAESAGEGRGEGEGPEGGKEGEKKKKKKKKTALLPAHEDAEKRVGWAARPLR